MHHTHKLWLALHWSAGPVFHQLWSFLAHTSEGHMMQFLILGHKILHVIR